MSDHIFPRKDAEFKTYLDIAAPYLTTNATRLVVSAGNVTDLAALKTIWDTKYLLSQSENTATKTIIEEKTEAREDVEELLRFIYGDIPQSALTPADRNTLNLKARQAGSARPAITTAPGLRLFALGNLEVRIESRVVGDESRPSLHPDADAIEFRTLISDTPPATYEQATVVTVSKKARHTRIIDDPLAAGKKLFVFARYINASDNAKSGPWSSMATVIIS